MESRIALKSSILKPAKHNSIEIGCLRAGDILLYSANDELGTDIADSTKGHFSHAAIFVGRSGIEGGEILHTGFAGANLVSCEADFGRKLNGVYVVRASLNIDEYKLYKLAKEKEGIEYDFGSLKYIGLASWDRRTLESGTGVYRFIPKKAGETFVKIFNRKGSAAVCSGLSLSLLGDASIEKIFPRTAVGLDQFSPNCIYEEALKDDSNASIFELIPFSDEEVTRNRKHFFLAGLSLKKSI